MGFIYSFVPLSQAALQTRASKRLYHWPSWSHVWTTAAARAVVFHLTVEEARRGKQRANFCLLPQLRPSHPISKTTTDGRGQQAAGDHLHVVIGIREGYSMVTTTPCRCTTSESDHHQHRQGAGADDEPCVISIRLVVKLDRGNE